MKNKFLHSLAYFCFFLAGCPSQRTDKEFLKREADYSKIRVAQVARAELTTLKFEDYHLRGDERLLYVWKGEDKNSFDRYADIFYRFCNGYPLPNKDELKELVEKEGLRFIVADKDIKRIKQAGFLNSQYNCKRMEITSWQDFLEMYRSHEEKRRELGGRK